LDWKLRDRATLSPENFERCLMFRADDGRPVIQKITVHELADGNYVLSCLAPREPNQLWRTLYGPPAEIKLVPAKVIPSKPYKPSFYTGVQAKPDMTVVDFLTEYERLDREKNKEKAAFSWGFAWSEQPKWIWLMWTGGAVIVVGGIWPFILNLLIGAGFGRPPRSKEKEYDLSRFGKGAPEKKEEKKAVVTQEDMDQLKALEAELEAKLRAEGKIPPPAPVGPRGAAAVRKLSAKPVDAPATPAKPEEKKEFGASREDFYPTEVHRPKKRE
jgi:hypothetical protein